jgi:hypothetical protein
MLQTELAIKIPSYQIQEVIVEGEKTYRAIVNVIVYSDEEKTKEITQFTPIVD